MNQNQINLVLRMYNLFTEIALECEQDDQFNQFIAEQHIFKRSIDEILSDFDREQFE